MSLYESLKSVALTAHEADRYTPTAASTAPDLERLRRELYHYAAGPAPTVAQVPAADPPSVLRRLPGPRGPDRRVGSREGYPLRISAGTYAVFSDPLCAGEEAFAVTPGFHATADAPDLMDGKVPWPR